MSRYRYLRMPAALIVTALLLMFTGQNAHARHHPATTAPVWPGERTQEKVTPSIKKLEEGFNLTGNDTAIIVNPGRQELYLVKNKKILKIYNVSTSKFGLGNRLNSFRTPWGTHRIKERIGAGAASGTIFKHKENLGKIAKIITEPIDTPGFITSRIMALEGLEPEINKGRDKGINIDSYERYIYIHGTSEEGLVGHPNSGGCINMKNGDVIELFDLVSEGTLVEILKEEWIFADTKISKPGATTPKVTGSKPSSTKKTGGRAAPRQKEDVQTPDIHRVH